MTVGPKEAVDDRFLGSGDEAGTAPGDRSFRPDVQGLRAVAIALVVLFHAGIPGLSGGYVGVDVFFVISGFVITGLLLRESASTGTTSVLAFYARRARRIIPAATLVIVATVIATFLLLDKVTANQTAVDGQWASLFMANFHFAASGTNYLASQRPPSPLQNFWSLAVEEQFYLVYPTIFLLVASVRTRVSLRVRLSILLGLVVVSSFVLSIVQTGTNPSAAFFSPFTRAWELALGGLVALSTQAWRRLPHNVAAGISWLGLGAILLSAFVYSSSTPYPGSAVAIPVVGTALIIVGGAARPSWGVESLLRLRPFQLLGLISYSLYLWHWPLLTISAERLGDATLPTADSLLVLLVALVLSIGTYLIVENPVRHLNALVIRRGASVAMGACLITSSLILSAAVDVGSNINVPLADLASGSVCPTPTPQELPTSGSASRAQGAPAPSQRYKATMIVVGDSTACSLLPGLMAGGSAHDIRVENAAVLGCGVVSDQVGPYYKDGSNLTAYSTRCQQEALDVEASADLSGQPNIVLWSSAWERSPLIYDGRVLNVGTPPWRELLLARMAARVRAFAEQGAVTVILTAPPFVDATTSDDGEFHQLNALLRGFAADHEREVAIVDLAGRVCPSGPPCPYAVAGLALRPDNEHYSPTTSLWVANWLIPQIVAAADSRRSLAG